MLEQNGTSIHFVIQVADHIIGGQVRPEMSSAEFVEGTKERLQAVGLVVADAIEPFFHHLSALATKPSECAIEFGVNVGGEAGIPFVTKGTIGANFKVSLKWSWGDRK